MAGRTGRSGRPGRGETGVRPAEGATSRSRAKAQPGGGSMDGLLATKEIAIACGPGGVGKTTTAASVAAMAAAEHGGRVLVLTVDPAKRLADALGLEELSNEAHRVDGDWGPGGELWELMLDTKTTFDDVVARNAGSAQQAQAILDNRLYRNISSALGGTQEYMAMEKLY